MLAFSNDPQPKPLRDISRAQVARFIRRMTLVGEGDTRLVRVLEDADGVGLSVSLDSGRAGLVSQKTSNQI